MFGICKYWCPESLRKTLAALPGEFHFCLYDSGHSRLPFVDFLESGVCSFDVRFADTLSHKTFYLPQGRIGPDWCAQVIQDIGAFIDANDYLPVAEVQALGQEIMDRLHIEDESQTGDTRNVAIYLGKYPLEQRRRILQFLLELDEDAPWATVEFNLYQVSAEGAEKVRMALDIMETAS